MSLLRGDSLSCPYNDATLLLCDVNTELWAEAFATVVTNKCHQQPSRANDSLSESGWSPLSSRIPLGGNWEVYDTDQDTGFIRGHMAS